MKTFQVNFLIPAGFLEERADHIRITANKVELTGKKSITTDQSQHQVLADGVLIDIGYDITSIVEISP